MWDHPHTPPILSLPRWDALHTLSRTHTSPHTHPPPNINPHTPSHTLTQLLRGNLSSHSSQTHPPRPTRLHTPSPLHTPSDSHSTLRTPSASPSALTQVQILSHTHPRTRLSLALTHTLPLTQVLQGQAHPLQRTARQRLLSGQSQNQLWTRRAGGEGSWW